MDPSTDRYGAGGIPRQGHAVLVAEDDTEVGTCEFQLRPLHFSTQYLLRPPGLPRVCTPTPTCPSVSCSLPSLLLKR